MSIFGSLGKLFGYKGASAEAFGGSFAEKASTTFTDRFNKSIDSFEKQVEETDKLLFFFNHMEIVVNAKRKSLMGNKFVPIADEKYRNAQRQKWFSDSNSSSNNIKGRDDVIEVETNNVMEVDNDKNNIHATNKKPKI